MLNFVKIIIPRNLECYYKMKNKDRCIFVFEHMGSRSDKALYPQCELIIRQVSEYKKETESVFPYNSEISKNIFDVFIKFALSVLPVSVEKLRLDAVNVLALIVLPVSV
jgi:hypothetical protein